MITKAVAIELLFSTEVISLMGITITPFFFRASFQFVHLDYMPTVTPAARSWLRSRDTSL